MCEWLYEKDGQRFAAPSETALQAMIENGTLDSQSLVWRRDLPCWLPLAQTVLRAYLPKSARSGLPLPSNESF